MKNNNLYPPIVNTYTPAFVIGTSATCRIYFSLSVYTSLNMIQNAQVSVKNQLTNANVLKRSAYPSGIKICKIKTDDDKKSDDKYYIEIKTEDLEDNFQINQYYKVQIRFTSISASTPPDKITDAWLTEQADNFSEWSTICLIRGISKPTLKLTGFDNIEGSSIIIAETLLNVVGTLSFEDTNEKETLKSYQLKLYNLDNKILIDSGVIYSNSYSNVNEINYTFKYMLQDGAEYKLVIEYTTSNLYTEKFNYSFIVLQNTLDGLNAYVSAEVEPELGSIKVTLDTKQGTNFTGCVVFKRASSKSNFTIWEDIYTITFNDKILKATWYDYTVESGIWYKYCAQRKDSQNNRSVVTPSSEPTMVILDDMFLCGDKKQLRIKYNPQISSYKKSVSESKTDTIGSQYPFIKRNGAIAYRQFSLSGMITFHSDYKNTFVTKDDLYGNDDIQKLYAEYNDQQEIGEYNDFIHEREFRNKVMDFLYADTVKLMRTTTEGNILVKLMDINLTPEVVLGRMIYSFSATAYEIADNTIENMNKYNITGGTLQLGESNSEDTEIYDEILKIGQEIQSFQPNIEIIEKILFNKYQYLIRDNFSIQIEGLPYLRLEFNMPPYLIHEDETGNLTPLKEAPKDATTVLGYLVEINKTLIYINPEGIYELNSKINVTSLSFPVESDVTMDYIIKIKKKESYSHRTDVLYFYDKVGQIWGTFKNEESVFHRIMKRYEQEYKKYYLKLVSINGIRIEAEPNTVCWIKDSSSKDMKRFVISETCSLSLFDDSAVIEGLYFGGIHLEPLTENDKKLKVPMLDKYVDTGITINSFDEISNPISNGVYSLSASITKSDINFDKIEILADQKYYTLLDEQIKKTNKVIFYNNHWYTFTENHDVLCDVDGMIDYWCEVMKGVHIV